MESVGVASGAHPNLNLTAEEKRVYGHLFNEADPDGFGAISGDVAVGFFERTRLPPDVLGQIWQLADTENRGFLTPAGFGVVLRLIAHAQAGRTPTAQLASQPAPLPRFDPKSGQQPPQAPLQQAPLQTQSTGTPASPVQSNTGMIRVPALQPDKVAEYSSLFEKSGAENGQLSGLAAKNIFEKARLPNEVLGRIWNLADQSGKGSLDVTEFVIAMHLLASFKTGVMRGVPNSLPPGLLEAAARRAPVRMNTARPPSSAGPLPPALSQQLPGGQFGNVRPQSPIVGVRTGTPLREQYTGEQWLITPADKQKFDQIFNDQDKTGQGFITGEQAVQFFGNARLPEEVLASIWDLADINSDGVLNRDEFAVAMYLIRQQRGSTSDRRGNLPQILPLALVPPSMRKVQQQAQQTTAPAFDDAPVTKPRTAADDLFGIDLAEPIKPQTREVQPPAPLLQVSQSTGETDPFSNAITSSQPFQSISGPSAAASFQPFKPSSSFGMGLLPQATGTQTQTRAAPLVESSLLEDADPVANSRINGDAAELGNMSNQINTLSTQITSLQQERNQHDQQIVENAGQKQVLQERLTELRATYEREASQVRTLKEQLAVSQNETKRMQQDMAMLQGGHADLQTQSQQLQAALQADQQENAALKERIRLLNSETEQLKPQIEKLRSDIRQQKGLVAINKKQLATNELERDKIKEALTAARQEHEESMREADGARQQLEASQKELEQTRNVPKVAPTSKAEASQTAPVTRGLSHEASETKNIAASSPSSFTSSNPFFRAPESGAVFSPPMGSTVASPEPQKTQHTAFDDIFGPSATSTSAAPTTSFSRDTPSETSQHLGSRSSTPRIIEPPPAAPANQMDSSVLPFRNKPMREDSMTSSVKVAPPGSRISPAVTPRTFTPDTSTASPSSHRDDNPFAPSAADEEQESMRQAIPPSDTTKSYTNAPVNHAAHDTFAPSAADEEQESVRAALPRDETQEKISKVESLPGAFPGDNIARSTTPTISSNPTAVAVGAGAASLVAGAGLAAAAMGQDHKKTAPPKDNFDDFFGGPTHRKTASEQARDFDSAFANMGTTTDATGYKSSEFPDIKELDADDDDDDDSSDDDDEPRGFDDNFGSSSNPINSTALGEQSDNTPAVLGNVVAQARPTPATNSTMDTLPDITQQTSPPSYGEAAPRGKPNHFPMEYKNLLPEREDPTSPINAGGSSKPLSPPPGQIPPALYGPEIGHATRDVPASQITAPAPSKASPFDFDSAFAGVGHAPAAATDDSDSDYDGDDEPKKDGELHTIFNPTFASFTPSSRTTNATTHSSTNQNVSIYAEAPAQPVNTTTSPNVTNGFADYSPATTIERSVPSMDGHTSNNVGTPPLSQSQGQYHVDDYPPTNAPAPVTAGISHDWDALFAPLSNQSPTQPTINNNLGGSTAHHQSTQIAPNQNATTTAEAVDDDSGTATPIPASGTSTSHITIPNTDTTTTTPNTNVVPAKPEAPKQTFPSSALTPHGPPPPSSAALQSATGTASSGTRLERPQPGRALSTGTEHDDPILKRLTAMGFTREDALLALEKFDYNIDKAADWLTFKT